MIPTRVGRDYQMIKSWNLNTWRLKVLYASMGNEKQKEIFRLTVIIWRMCIAVKSGNEERTKTVWKY